MDLNKVASDALAKVIASGKIEATIEKKIGETVASILDDQLRSYSDFGKLIAEAVKKSLHVGELGLPAYNALIVKLVRRQVGQLMSRSIQAQVAEQLTDLLRMPPETLKFSDLIKEFKAECVRDANRGGCHCDPDPEAYHKCTIRVDRESYGYSYLCFDAKPHKAKYECKYRIGVTEAGKVYTISVNGVDPNKDLFVGPFYGFERMLFQVHAAGTKLIDDTAEVDIEESYSMADGEDD